MLGYVKDKNNNILYKVDLPDNVDNLKLNEGEIFVPINDREELQKIPITHQIDDNENQIKEEIKKIVIETLQQKGLL